MITELVRGKFNLRELQGLTYSISSVIDMESLSGMMSSSSLLPPAREEGINN